MGRTLQAEGCMRQATGQRACDPRPLGSGPYIVRSISKRQGKTLLAKSVLPIDNSQPCQSFYHSTLIRILAYSTGLPAMAS